MVDKNNTNKKRLLNEHYPEQPPLTSLPARKSQRVLLQPCEKRDEIVRRSEAGHSLRRIASELGLTFAEVVHIIGIVS